MINTDTRAPDSLEVNFSEVLNVLLAAGVNLSEPGSDGLTPAYIAAQYGHVDVLRFLYQVVEVSDFSTSTKEGFTPVFVAVQYGYVDVLQFLYQEVKVPELNVSVPDFFILPRIAVQEGQVEALEFLYNVIKVVNLNELEGNDETLVSFAAYCGQADVLRFLDKVGADLTQALSDGSTPLSLAKAEGHLEAVQVLEALIAQRQKISTEGGLRQLSRFAAKNDEASEPPEADDLNKLQKLKID